MVWRHPESWQWGLPTRFTSEPLPRYTDLPGEPEEAAEAADEYFHERQKEVAEVAAQHGLAIGCETRSDHSEMWGRLLGDTADRISDHAHCSVLIVKN